MCVLCRHMHLNVNTLFRNQFPNVRTIWESPKIMSASAPLPSASSPAGKELFQPRCGYRWPWPTFAPRGPELAGKLGLSCGPPVLKAWSNSQVAGAWGVSPFPCQLRSPTRNTHPLNVVCHFLDPGAQPRTPGVNGSCRSSSSTEHRLRTQRS